MQLAQLMRGGGEEHFFSLGDVSPLRQGKYIVTLDADTVPGIDQIKRLVGTMAHPLNQPVIKDRRVVSGYGVIEPGVDVSVTSLKTDFALLYAWGGIESNLIQNVNEEYAYDKIQQGTIDNETAMETTINQLLNPDGEEE